MKVRFFELAKKVANLSNHHTHQLGSVLVRKNRVASVGTNSLKTNPNSPHAYKSTHAEFSAILSSGKHDLSGYELYVYRERKDGQLGMSEPCSSCMTLIKKVNIEKIHYSTDDGYKTEIL